MKRSVITSIVVLLASAACLRPAESPSRYARSYVAPHRQPGPAPDATREIAQAQIGKLVDIDRVEIGGWCSTVVFETKEKGEVRCEQVTFVTDDAGLSFREMHVPRDEGNERPARPRGPEVDDHGEPWPGLGLPSDVLPRGGRDPEARAEPVERASASVAWVESQREDDLSYPVFTTHLTADGGQTWIAWPTFLDRDDGPLFLGKLSFRGGEHLVVAARPVASVTDVLLGPTFPLGPRVSRWGDGVVAQVDSLSRLSYFEGGRRVRSTRLRTPGGARQERIVGVDTPGGHELTAWTDHALLASFDGGISWSTRTTVEDTTIVRASVVEADADDSVDFRDWLFAVGPQAWSQARHLDITLIELRDGRVLSMRKSWLKPHPQPAVARYQIDRALAAHEGQPPPPSHLRCLAHSEVGEVALDYAIVYDGREFPGNHQIRWSWSGGEAQHEQDGVSGRVEASALREALARVTEAYELPQDGCLDMTMNTGGSVLSSTLTWRCDKEVRHARFMEVAWHPKEAGCHTGTGHRLVDALGGIKPWVPAVEARSPPASPLDEALPAAPPVLDGRCPAGMTAVPPGRYALEPGGETFEIERFCLDATEVTVAAYRGCVDRGACSSPEAYRAPPAGGLRGACNWRHPERRDDHPINCVRAAQAGAFCAARGARLPTEQEWAWAARSGERAWVYPWGDSPPDAARVNACGAECTPHVGWDAHGGKYKALYPGEDGYPETSPVGIFGGGDDVWGIHDLAGNVWEWTSSRYSPDTNYFVVRGGGWSTISALWLAAATRDQLPAGSSKPGLGFRCARAR
jgi:formylglycine-generating enzyme required for sulfatase activity